MLVGGGSHPQETQGEFEKGGSMLRDVLLLKTKWHPRDRPKREPANSSQVQTAVCFCKSGFTAALPHLWPLRCHKGRILQHPLRTCVTCKPQSTDCPPP